MTQTLRQITTVGNSLGITLPREMLGSYGLEKGALVELRPTPEGVLIQPAKVVSALSPEGKATVKGIVRRYRRAFDALAKGERKIAER